MTLCSNDLNYFIIIPLLSRQVIRWRRGFEGGGGG
eukprot:SAG11_NODE_4355_length_1935_cov_0.935185_1_plen_34_part_10